MKSFSFFLVPLMLSFSVYSAQSTGKDKVKRPGFIEKRQERAREMRKDNFKAVNLPKKNVTNNSLGFHKPQEEDTLGL